MSVVVERRSDVGITVVSQWIFNCYVVHDGGAGRPFVVDLGLPSHLAPVCSALAQLGFAPSDLACAVATHGHADHVGGLPQVHRRGVAVALPHQCVDGARLRSPGPRELARIVPVMRDQPFALGPWRELAAAQRDIGYGTGPMKQPIADACFLHDGDTVPGAPDWAVIHTPGHTDDSLSFYRASTGTLLSGDAVLSVDGHAWFNPEKVDPSLSKTTERALRALTVEDLFPGHGRPVSGHKVWEDALSSDERPIGLSGVDRMKAVLRRHR